MSSTQSENSKHESAWLENILRKVSHDNSISRIVKVTKEEIGVKGDNYASRITRVTLDMILNSGRKSKKTLIVKSPLDLSLPLPLFKLEIKIYNILSEFNALMNEFQDPNDAVWCEMVAHEPYSIIILEDLKAKNFKVADRRNCLDMNHALLVLNSLGRFHAISHVLLKRGIISPEDFGAHLMCLGNPFAKRMIEGGFEQLAYVMEKHWGQEWKEASQRVAKFSKIVMDKINRTVTEYPKDSFLVMVHGDTWTCNMMFKYSSYEESRPIAVKFFDLPFASINSYILDVVHFTHLCLRSEVRRENIDSLYGAYQKSLASALEFYGESGVAPTLEQVQTEAKRAECIGMFFSACLYAPFIFETSDGFSFEKCLSSCPAKDAYNPKVFNTERYRKSVEPDIKRWLDQGLI